MKRILALLIIGCAAVLPASAQDTLTRSDVETIVREYLLANPEILEEAFAALQTRRQAAEEEARVASLAQYRDKLLNDPNDPILGNPDGDVTLVEFFDYNCGFCRRAMADMEKLIESDPNLRIVLKEFPVLGQQSMDAAAVSIAVARLHPEAYGEFHKRLMAVEGPATGTTALEITDALELPRGEIEAKMQSSTIQEVVEDSYEIATALGLSGTPSYVVGDTVEFGAVGYEQLKARINEARCGEVTC